MLWLKIDLIVYRLILIGVCSYCNWAFMSLGMSGELKSKDWIFIRRGVGAARYVRALQSIFTGWWVGWVREARGRLSSKGLQLAAREWPTSQTWPALAARSSMDFCIRPLQPTFHNFIFENNYYPLWICLNRIQYKIIIKGYYCMDIPMPN